MQTLTIRKPFDAHVHFRVGPMLQAVTPLIARWCQVAIAMPNTTPAIISGTDALVYKDQIVSAARSPIFIPLMTVKLTDETRPGEVKDWVNAGVVAAKLYPTGVTTGSANGVSNTKILFDVFLEMAQAGIILSIHGEMPGIDPQLAEQSYLPTIREILDLPRRPKTIVEHISSAEAIKLVNEYGGDVFATITPHHMVMTDKDVYDRSGRPRPLNWCKPPAKTEEDREAVINAALTSIGKYFYGTDFAPHPGVSKFQDSPAAGCANLPVGLIRVIEIADRHGKLDWIESFTSSFGAKAYGVELSDQTITFERKSSTVPRVMHIANEDSLYFWEGGQTCEWSLVG